MCGIAGIIARTDPAGVQAGAEAMLGSLGHRGPDSHGMNVYRAGDWTVAFAHTRLAILDLSPEGHQPMASADGSAHITYNGEVYNFGELREQLSGYPFHSRSDTEVMLAAYQKWGDSAPERFRGMFAFGLWDEPKRHLLLARDAFGIKPLYYFQTPQLLVFASEVRALLASGLVPRKLSTPALESFLRSGSVEAPLTVIEGIRSLMPGDTLSLSVTGLTLTSRSGNFASKVLDSTSAPPKRREEAVEQVRELLKDSVRHHLISDVPLGLFLSGGIDSSALVALASEGGSKVKTFSVVFAEKDFSEASHAQGVADAYGTCHQEIALSEAGLLDQLPHALSSMDQPTSDGVNTFVISQAVRQAGVTVALSGLGGDELFAGYRSFQRAMQLKGLSVLPQALRQAAASAGRKVFHSSIQARKLWDLFGSDATAEAAYTLSRRFFAEDEISALLGRKPSAAQPAQLLDEDWVNAVSRHELGGYMANTLLRDSDVMSMAHALEIRVPFVDTELARYVLSLPGEWKLDKARPKPLLLDALGGLLPEHVWKRRKMGFTLPFPRWMRTALRPELDQVLCHGKNFEALGVNSGAVRRMWHEFLEQPGQRGWARPWALYGLSRWCELNGVERC